MTKKVLRVACIIVFLAIVIVTALGIYLFNFYNNAIPVKSDKASNVIVNEQPTANETQTQIANPASTNCVKLGGNLVIQKRGDGGEYGLCYFEENRACEEWALLRGDCPYGGRKTTGYITIDQNYCAWTGGYTLAETNSACTFKNGSKCPTIDFYNGTCLPEELIKVDNVSADQIIASPLSITGEARGNWFFEAGFPIKLYDENGTVVGTAVAQALTDWMTENFVPFKAELEFQTPTSTSGRLVFEKDNPSGLSENAGQISIPVIFSK